MNHSQINKLIIYAQSTKELENPLIINNLLITIVDEEVKRSHTNNC